MDILQHIKAFFTSLTPDFLLNYLGLLDPEKSLYYGIAFLLLALFWYNTGRLFLVGWLVRIWWLQINFLAFVLWVFAAFIVNIVFDFLRSYVLFVRVVSVLLIFICYMSFEENKDYFVPILMGTLLFFYLLKFGLNEDRFYSWIFYSPKAKRTPEPRTKNTTIKATKKQIKDAKGAELLPFTTIQFLPKPQKDFETEAEIIEKLDDHLKRLIRGNRP